MSKQFRDEDGTEQQPAMQVLLGAREFNGWLENLLDLPAESIRSETRLVEDLELDSLGLFEIIMGIDEAGTFLEERSLQGLVTAGDLYRAYAVATGARGATADDESGHR